MLPKMPPTSQAATDMKVALKACFFEVRLYSRGADCQQSAIL